MSAPLHLVNATAELLDAAIGSDALLASALGAEVAPGWAVFTEALRYARAHLVGDALLSGDPWGTYLFVEASPRRLVGVGGFKGPPDAVGRVELGYAIAESLRNRGLATAATHALVERAFADPAVTQVLAHTLAEENASTRVLRKAGFAHLGTVETTDDGPVWQFAMSR